MDSDELVAETEAVSVDGWDFSWLDGRAGEPRPSWSKHDSRLLRTHGPPSSGDRGEVGLSGVGVVGRGFGVVDVVSSGWAAAAGARAGIAHVFDFTGV